MDPNPKLLHSVEGTLTDMGHGFPPSCLLPEGWELSQAMACDADKASAREAGANILLLGPTPNPVQIDLVLFFYFLGYL